MSVDTMDYFAGLAMQELMSKMNSDHQTLDWDEIAADAYTQAEAMMAERKKVKEAAAARLEAKMDERYNRR